MQNLIAGIQGTGVDGSRIMKASGLFFDNVQLTCTTR